MFRINIRCEDAEEVFGDYGKEWAAQISQGVLLALHVTGEAETGDSLIVTTLQVPAMRSST